MAAGNRNAGAGRASESAYRATPALLERARRQLIDTGRVQNPKPASAIRHRPPSPGAGGVPELVHVLTGKEWVYCMAFSPDGRLLASGGGDNTVRLWDPATGEHRRTLTGHKASVYCVAFSPDGRLLASCGGKDGAAVGPGHRRAPAHPDRPQRQRLGGGVQPGRAAAGRGGGDKTVRLWDPATGEHRRTLTGHSGCVLAVAFSPDGRLLASGSEDGTVRLWDPATGGHRHTLTGHAGTVHAVAFSPDGRLLASGGDKTVRLWDPATGEHRRTLTGHTGWISGVAFSLDGRLLASCGRDNSVRLWDPDTGERGRTLTGYMGGPAYLQGVALLQGVAFSPDGRLLASTCGNDKTVKLWDLTSTSGS